jgi:hypothetical protein
VPGDARLLYRLVSNLVDNAIRYNTTGGRVEVKLASSTTEATLTVTNTGALVRPDQVSRLLEPFQRAAPDRTVRSNGLGLGLSIVGDVADAHGAGLEVRSRPQGALTVAVSFPSSHGPFPTRTTTDVDLRWRGLGLLPNHHGRREETTASRIRMRSDGSEKRSDGSEKQFGAWLGRAARIRHFVPHRRARRPRSG